MIARARSALLVVLVASTAMAAPRDRKDKKTVEAKERYESGLSHFNLQEYDQAIDDFEAGYRLRPNPTFLYNIAQAHRLAGRSERALYFYRAFLHTDPDAENVQEVERRIAELEAKPADAPKPPPAVTPPATPPSSSTANAAATGAPANGSDLSVARAAAPRPRKKTWVWGVAIGAVVVVGAGVALGVVLGTRAHDPAATLGSQVWQ